MPSPASSEQLFTESTIARPSCQRCPRLDGKGPDHSKCFKIAAVVGRYTHAGAWGRTKKEAEQRAAMNALAQIHGEPLPYDHD